MKTIILCILLVCACSVSSAQSEAFNTEVSSFLAWIESESTLTLLEDGEATTSSDLPIYPPKTSFYADSEYSVLVVVDGCTWCDIVFNFLYTDGDRKTLDPIVSTEGGLLFGVFHFKNEETENGQFEIYVDSDSRYYIHYYVMLQ